MWFKAYCRLPYYGDPDYRFLLISAIKTVISGNDIDTTLLQDYGFVEVDASYEEAIALQLLPNISCVRRSIDRGILVR